MSHVELLFTVVSLILLLSVSLSIFSKLPVAELLPTSIFLIIIWLTGFGVADQLQLGFRLIFPLILLILILSLFKLHKFSTFKSAISIPGPAIFSFVFLSWYTFQQTREMKFHQWDEFSHWGLSVKATYLANAIGPNVSPMIDAPTYVPGLSIFSYFVMNISSGWNEGDVFWAYQLIILSVFISVLSKSKWKHSLFLVVSLFFMVQASIVFYDTFSTIYADPILGITFAYLFYLAISKQTLVSNWNFANFLIALSAFILIKDISIGLVIIPIIAITFNQLIFSVSRISDSLEVVKITIFRSCTSLAVVFLTRLIWAAFVHDGEINATVALSNSPNRFNNIFTESSKSSEIKTSLIYEVIHGQIGESRIFDFAVLDWIAIFLVLSVLFVVSSRSKLDFWLRLSTSLTLLAGSFLYLFVLFLSYLTVFDGENASSLTSFDRYISTYLTGALLFFTFMAAQELNDFNVNRLRLNRNLSGAIIVSVPILSIFIAALLIRYDKQERLATYRDKPADYSTRVRIPFDDLAQRFNDAKFNNEDRIWVITQHKHGFEYYLLQYELLPASVPANPFSIGTPYNSEDIWTDTSMTKARWDAELNNFDFVVVFNSTQTFIDEFGSLFEDPESLNAQGIYRVVRGTSGNLLVAYK